MVRELAHICVCVCVCIFFGEPIFRLERERDNARMQTCQWSLLIIVLPQIKAMQKIKYTESILEQLQICLPRAGKSEAENATGPGGSLHVRNNERKHSNR